MVMPHGQHGTQASRYRVPGRPGPLRVEARPWPRRRPSRAQLALTEGSREALQPVRGQAELSEAAQASDLGGQRVQEVLREIEALQSGQGPQRRGQRLQAVVGHSKESEGGEAPQRLGQL